MRRLVSGMTVSGAGCFDMSYSLNSLSRNIQGTIIALITGDTQSHHTINCFENIEGWYRDMQGLQQNLIILDRHPLFILEQAAQEKWLLAEN